MDTPPIEATPTTDGIEDTVATLDVSGESSEDQLIMDEEESEGERDTVQLFSNGSRSLFTCIVLILLRRYQ